MSKNRYTNKIVSDIISDDTEEILAKHMLGEFMVNNTHINIIRVLEDSDNTDYTKGNHSVIMFDNVSNKGNKRVLRISINLSTDKILDLTNEVGLNKLMEYTSKKLQTDSNYTLKNKRDSIIKDYVKDNKIDIIKDTQEREKGLFRTNVVYYNILNTSKHAVAITRI